MRDKVGRDKVSLDRGCMKGGEGGASGAVEEERPRIFFGRGEGVLVRGTTPEAATLNPARQLPPHLSPPVAQLHASLMNQYRLIHTCLAADLDLASTEMWFMSLVDRY